MHNQRLFYFLSIKKLAPDHIMPTHRADALVSKLCYAKFSPSVMVLVSSQSALYNEDLNFQFNFKNNLGRSVPDKRIIHLLNLKE